MNIYALILMSLVMAAQPEVVTIWPDPSGSLPMTCKRDPNSWADWECRVNIVPMDVPAVQVTDDYSPYGLPCDWERNPKAIYGLGCPQPRWTCGKTPDDPDRHRALLIYEDKTRHCVKFQ